MGSQEVRHCPLEQIAPAGQLWEHAALVLVTQAAPPAVWRQRDRAPQSLSFLHTTLQAPNRQMVPELQLAFD